MYAEKATPSGATYTRSSPKPVFVATKDIPPSSTPPTGEELYCSLMKCVNTEHIAGIQRIGSLWRIYLTEHDDRVKVIVNGILLRGVTVPVHDVNPFTKARDEMLTRVLIKDVPLSVGDDLIKATLEGMKYKVRGEITRQQLRVGGQLTNCLNGDRVVYIVPPTQPLPRFLVIGNVFRARAFHTGQPEKANTTTATCSKCLDNGHHASTCQNPVKCRTCKESGHFSHSCPKTANSTLTPERPDNHGNDNNSRTRSAETIIDDNRREARETRNAEKAHPDVHQDARGRKARQIDISEFLRAAKDAAGAECNPKENASRPGASDSTSHYSSTHDDGDEDFSSCYSSSSEGEMSPISPETPTPDKQTRGTKSTKRKLKGKKACKKAECKEKRK